jgi:hypothetical protein
MSEEFVVVSHMSVLDLVVEDVMSMLNHMSNLVDNRVMGGNLILLEDVFDVSVHMFDLDVLGMSQVVQHVVDNLDLLMLVEVLDSKLMLDHVHDLLLHLSIEGVDASNMDGMGVLVADNLVHMDNVSDEVVGNDSSVSSFDVILLEDPHDVSIDLASLEVLGSLHVSVEMVEDSNELLSVDGCLQVVVSLSDDGFSQDVLDGFVDSRSGPFAASFLDQSLKLFP